jgi:hypothetical protein
MIKTGQRHKDCYEHTAEERRNKPFEIIAHVDERLDAEEHHEKQNKTDAVEAGDAGVEPPGIKQRSDDSSDCQGERDIEIKQVTPAEMFANPAAKRDADNHWHEGDYAPNCEAQRSDSLGIFVEQQPLPDRERDTARKTKNNAGRQKEPQGLADRAQKRSQRKNDEARRE